MMAKRTVLLGMLICLTGVAAFGQPAAIAPNVGGDIGLFTMSTADNPRAGQFTLGFYAWYSAADRRAVLRGSAGQDALLRPVRRHGVPGTRPDQLVVGLRRPAAAR